MKSSYMKKFIAGIILILYGFGIIAACGSNSDNEQPQYIAQMSEYYDFNLVESNLFEGQFSDEELGDYQLCFSGDIIGSFGELRVGKGRGEFGGMYIKLSPEKMQIINSRDDSIADEYALSIGLNGYISVSIMADLRNNAVIEVSSEDGMNSFNTVWSARQGKLFVSTNEDTQIQNCHLSYHCNGWDKPIWLMGDSYFNCTASSRWTSYLTNNGYENYLLNGYSGRGSDRALESLMVMLNYATPREIIWCLGMNDGDGEEINSDWLESIEELKTICEEKDITLVLATIPNCPTVNNKLKNEYVRNSGYRYIDFANAVGAADDSDWYDGMLEDADEPVHPTQSGAMALYNEAVSTCPEILH